MIRIFLAVAAAMLLVAAVGCERSTSPIPPPPPPPPPSGAVVSLMTPNANDGAVIITLSGPDLGTIQPADSHYVVYSRLANSQEMRIIVLGDLVAGPVFSVRLSAPHAMSAYAGTVQQVATRSDSILSGTAGYGVTISPAP